MQSNDQEGRAAWNEQRCVWKTQFGENAKVTPRTRYPLCPGGAPLFSGECYRCGKMGHCHPDCTATEVTSANECEWHMIAGQVAGHRGLARVNTVDRELADEFAWENRFGARDSQGNREGPST